MTTQAEKITAALTYLEPLVEKAPRDVSWLFDWLKRKATTKAANKVRKRSEPGGVKALTRELDEVFSEWIRKRDAAPVGLAFCVTCGKSGRWQDMDCGHFQSRRFLATRWEPKNCAAQCRACNRFAEGKHAEFAKAIDKRWGAQTSDKLIILAKQPTRPMKFQLKAMIEYYKWAIPDSQNSGP